MTANTPGPWHARQAMEPLQDDYLIYADVDGRTTCLGEFFGFSSTNVYLPAEANAALVVRAVAAHDDLVAALEIIAGRRQPIDNLMSNKDVAEAVLKVAECHGQDGFDANANFIVRACDAHDDLVAALNQARVYVASAGGDDLQQNRSDYVLTILDAALKKATAP